MRIIGIKSFTYLISITLFFTYGVITAQYKIFPYNEIRNIKQIVVNDINVNANNVKSNKKRKEKSKSYYLDKVSFFEEHTRNVKIVMLGDSITDYAEWNDLFPSKEISNQGIRGDTTARVLDRIDLVYKTNAEKVFIMVGINDILTKNNLDRIFKNYQTIVNELIKNDIKVYIQSTLLVGNERKQVNDKIMALNFMLENFARTNQLITYIDLNETLSNGSYLSEKYSNDGLHLNGRGYKVWKDKISIYVM